MKGKSIIVLRWLGILPIACIVYILGYALFMFLTWVNTSLFFDSEGDGGWMTLYVWPLIATGLASFYFVSVGSMVAPNYKKGVALVLMILLCVFSGALFMGMVITRNYTTIIAGIAQILGALIGYLHIQEEERY